MTGAELAISSVAALLIGLLIGSVGIGGVLLVPWLTQAIGLPVRDAVAIAMLSFIATGIAALFACARSLESPGTIRWPLVLATAPGALLGAAVIALVPERAALALLAGAVAISGGRLLSRPPTLVAAPAASTPPPGWGVGGLAGFASSLTGTGGAMVLTPMLLWRGVPVLDAILLGQVVQLPIAATATLGHALGHGVDWTAGAAIGAMQVPGVLAGRRLAEALPVATVTRLLGLVLLAAAATLAAKAL